MLRNKTLNARRSNLQKDVFVTSLPPYRARKYHNDKTKMIKKTVASKAKSAKSNQKQNVKIKKHVILDVNNLSVQYHLGDNLYFNAVKNIDFKIHKGEVVGLVGESGSGKSTTAKAILGLASHSTGHIKIENELIPNKPKKIKGKINRWLASKVQMIFQDAKSSLNPREKVYDVIVEGAKNQKLYKKQSRALELKKINNFIQENKKHAGKKTYELISNQTWYDTELAKVNNFSDEKRQKAFLILDDQKIVVQAVKSKMLATTRTYKTSFHFYKKSLIAKKKKIIIDYWVKVKKITNKKNSKVKKDFNESMLMAKYYAYNQILKFKKYENDKIAQLKSDTKGQILKLKNDANEQKLKLKSDIYNIKNQFKINYKFEKKDLILAKNIYKNTLKEINSQSNFKKDVLKTQLAKANEKTEKLTDTNASKALAKQYKNFKKDNANVFSKRKFYQSLVKEVMNKVSISPEYINRYPGEFSGGQAQRIAIARTLAMKSPLIIADEPVSALDVSIQAQVINLLKKIINEEKLTMLFIAHDLQVVKYISDRILVMYKGQIIEQGKTNDVYHKPVHPYTKSLINAVPSIDDPAKIRMSKTYIPEFIEDFSNLDLIKKEWVVIKGDHQVFGTKAQVSKWKKQ